MQKDQKISFIMMKYKEIFTAATRYLIPAEVNVNKFRKQNGFSTLLTLLRKSVVFKMGSTIPKD